MEICLGVGLRQSRRVSGVDPMRVLDDLRLGGLPEHLDQAEDRRNAAGDDVGKRLSRIDRRQLIAFADEKHGVRSSTAALAHPADRRRYGFTIPVGGAMRALGPHARPHSRGSSCLRRTTHEARR